MPGFTAQVLVNVAKILVEESEEGDFSYSLWKNVMIVLDLMCCAAILFPIVGCVFYASLALSYIVLFFSQLLNEYSMLCLPLGSVVLYSSLS